MFEFILKALSPKKISKKVEKKIDKFVKDLPINAEADVTSVKLFSTEKICSCQMRSDVHYFRHIPVILAIVDVALIYNGKEIEGYKEIYFSMRGKYIGEMDQLETE
jgi:hypothetical protein